MPIEYITERSSKWKAQVAREIIEEEIAQKRWQIKVAIITHTPMTEDAAKGLEREIRELEREFKGVLRSFDPRPRKDEPIVSSYSIQLEPGEQLGYSL